MNLERGTLTMCRHLCGVSGRPWPQEPKAKRACRTWTCRSLVAEALRQRQERMQPEGHLLDDRLPVFVHPEGNSIRKSNLRRRSFLPLLRRAGPPRVRLHDLYHTAATLHLRQGTHPSVVQHMLGPSRVSITLDIYSYVLPTPGKGAAQRMDELLRAASEASGGP